MGSDGDTYTQPLCGLTGSGWLLYSPLCGLMGSGVTPRLSLSVDMAPSRLIALIHFGFRFSEGLVSCRGELAWEDEGRCRSHSERKQAELWPRAQVPIKLPFDRNLVWVMPCWSSCPCDALDSLSCPQDILFMMYWQCALKRCREPGPESDLGHAPSWDSSMTSAQLPCQLSWRCPGDAHAPSTSVPTEHLPFRSDVHMVLRCKGRREKLRPHRQ